MHNIIRTFAVTTLAAAIAVTLSGCGSRAANIAATPGKPVIVTTIQQGLLQDNRTLTATVRARVETELGFRTAGKVVQRLVDVGDIVRTGQPIARLDIRDYTLGVESALDQLRAATVDAEQSASDAARMGRLLDEGSVGAADHERQSARADAAAARLDQAQRALSLARNRAGYTTLLAPYAGVVTALHLEVGQVVGEGQLVVSLAREGEREIVADLPEGLLEQVRNLRATATPWTGDDAPIALQLREVSPVAAAATGTFRVRYAVAASSKAAMQRLALGATARLQLASAGAKGVTLPATALIKGSGAAGVWVVTAAGTGVQFQPVQILAFEPDAVRVSGLADGARVVTVGAQKLDAGMKVTPVERRSDAAVLAAAGGAL
jgi:RND family efflux transporter MFP subunit